MGQEGILLSFGRCASETAVEAKKRAKKERRYEAVQKALKIVINSMYGYLAGGFFYSDKQQAEEVTRIGRETVQRMAEVIEENGGVVIEIDTDGIYFSAPNGGRDTAQGGKGCRV